MKALKNISCLFAAIFSVCMFSCTERIDIKTNTGGTCLSIFGYITSDTMQHRIRVSKTAPYFSDEAAAGISGATVTISDGTITFPLTESADTAGLYLTAPDFYGVGGKTYTLDVMLDYHKKGTIDHFQAVDFMPKRGTFDTVYIDYNITTLGIPNVFLSGKLPRDQENNLAIFMYKKEMKATLFDSFLNIPYWQFEGYEFENLNFPFFIGDEDIFKGDTIVLAINTLSSNLLTYVSNVQSELNGSNPIFSGPPTNVETNIIRINTGEEIRTVGYFGAFSTEKAFVVAEKDF